MSDWSRYRRQQGDGRAEQTLSLSSAGQKGAIPPSGASTELLALRALLQISEAVQQAKFFDEALEVIAEQAMVALNAAAVSISRWDSEREALRTLINVGLLGPGELRWPENELHACAADPDLGELLLHGQPYSNAVDSAETRPDMKTWLHGVGKESELGVPIMYGNITWGELWAAGVSGRRFDRGDVQLLQAIAAHAALALGRSELFSTVWRYAFQDPLTGLANRRALDAFFDEIDWATQLPTVLLCDIDDFKDVNDRDGHPAGDALLRETANILAGTVTKGVASLAVRLGGDEFCIVLTATDLAGAEQLVHAINTTIAAAVEPGITMSWGAATATSSLRTGSELIAAADAALLEAKRSGRGLYSASDFPRPRIFSPMHPKSSHARRALDHLLPRVVDSLDKHRPPDTLAALEILAEQVVNAIDATGWSISAMTGDGSALRTMRSSEGLDIRGSGVTARSGVRTAAARPLSEHPAIAHAITTGTDVVQAIDDDSSGAAARFDRNRAVLGVGIADSEHRYLLEIYSARGHADLQTIRGLVRVLANYCVSTANQLGAHHTRAADIGGAIVTSRSCPSKYGP